MPYDPYIKFTETPSRLTTGIRVYEVSTGTDMFYCKPCYCEEYELDESSISTATAQPQPDMEVEKHFALTDSGYTCDKCGNEF